MKLELEPAGPSWRNWTVGVQVTYDEADGESHTVMLVLGPVGLGLVIYHERGDRCEGCGTLEDVVFYDKAEVDLCRQCAFDNMRPKFKKKKRRKK